MKQFIYVYLEDGEDIIINISDISRIKQSEYFMDKSEDDPMGETLIKDDEHVDFIMKNGETLKVSTDYLDIIDMLNDNGFLMDLIEYSYNLKKSRKEEKEEYYEIIHPQNENVKFVWRGGYQISIEQDGHSVGGINVLERNRDAVEKKIFEYIEENPNMF